MNGLEDANHAVQKKQQSIRQSQKMSRNTKFRLSMLILAIGAVGSVSMQRLIFTNWQVLALTMYGFSTPDQTHSKLFIIKQTMLVMSLFELTIAMVIMSIRMASQKISPVADRDPLSIALLNRILSNNIEQSLVFFGLYSYLILCHSPDLQAKYMFGLPLVFLLGRMVYMVSYIITTVVRIATVKSIGFGFSLVVNLVMIVQFILGQTSFMRGFLFGG